MRCSCLVGLLQAGGLMHGRAHCIIPKDATGLPCAPSSAGGGLGTAQVQVPPSAPPAASATLRWPLHHPSWGHDHHRNRCTSKGGKRQNPTGKEGRHVAGAVPAQHGQGSVPTCPMCPPSANMVPLVSTKLCQQELGTPASGLCVFVNTPSAVFVFFQTLCKY